MTAASSSSKHVLVVGGAGFLGSAITKRLLSQGHVVTSMSTSGRPFLTPSGHRPAWSTSPSVRWEKADAFQPESYKAFLSGEDINSSSSKHKLPPVSAVVSTVGVLLEGDYKGKGSSLAGTFTALARGWGLDKGNPLDESREGLYEKLNRDAALRVAQTWSSVLSSNPQRLSSASSPPPFIFISAEDIFRPIIDPRYIITKREAERELEEMSWLPAQRPQRGASSDVSDLETPDADGAGLAEEINEKPSILNNGTSGTSQDQTASRIFRPVFIRPGVMYHPHTRPISTIPAALLDLSSNIHSLLPSNSPTPANVLHGLLGQSSLARLLTLSPLHIDMVAKAVGAAMEDEGVWGVVNTRRIKSLAGFKEADLGEEVYGEGRVDLDRGSLYR